MHELLKTPLYDHHLAQSAKIVNFGGWALPVNYGSQIEEHHAVRNDCGLFDVSHMTVTDISGIDTVPFLEKLLANDILKATKQPGKALYSCMLNEQGGVIDDLIIYYINHEHCRLVTNASTRDKDIAWIQKQSKPFTIIVNERPDLALVAVQGPNAIEKSLQCLSTDFAKIASTLPRFSGAFYNEEFVGRTGYTGEDGFEFILPADNAKMLWQKLMEQGARACGLGARDTLRLEAGMALYGNDLDEQHTPLESGLGWAVSQRDGHDFIGKAALSQTPRYKMIGLTLLGKGVLRSHQPVLINEQQIGMITSGTFSPTLEKSVALARLQYNTSVDMEEIVQIQIRNKTLDAKVIAYPFIK